MAHGYCYYYYNYYYRCSSVPVEAVDHLEVATEILLRQMFQHTCINQTLHECTAILR